MNRIIYLIIIIGVINVCILSGETWIPQTRDYSVADDTAKLIDNYLTKLATERNFSGALLIIRGNERYFSKGYGWADKENKIPFTNTTLASIGSITKAFTAAAIMKLAEQKKISLYDPLKKFFRDVPSDKADITIHQLLTHSAGFHEFLKSDKGDYEKIETDKFLDRVFEEPLAFKPGEKSVYTNVGYSILGIIIEQVSGMEYEEFLISALFRPIGIKNIGYQYPPSGSQNIAVGYQNGKRWGTHQERFTQAGGGPYWNLKANGGLEASLDDMYLWLKGFSDHSVLSAESIDKMFTPHIAEDGYEGESWFGYGCNISQSRRNTKVIGNGGSNGIYFARIARLPEENVVFFLVTSESSVNANRVLPNISQIYFQGKIEQDALALQERFNTGQSEKIYLLLTTRQITDLADELKNENITVDDDMILLEVGQKLIEQGENQKAMVLYQYYTRTFPDIVVAWNDLGDVYLSLGNKTEALKCYNKALSLRPENQRAMEGIKKLSQ